MYIGVREGGREEQEKNANGHYTPTNARGAVSELSRR